MSNQIIKKIIDSYESFIVRLYCRIRFQIIHQRFLSEIGQYLSPDGTILDVGCGFGLFSLFFAQSIPGTRIRGLDLNQKRIKLAQAAARKLGLKNVAYEFGDARSLKLEDRFDTVYMLDIIHHIPVEAVEPLLREIRAHLNAGGKLIIKDVSDHPAFKRWFTYLLDKGMDYTCKVNYWSPEELMKLLRASGFSVKFHALVDILPYPHMLYICSLQPD